MSFENGISHEHLCVCGRAKRKTADSCYRCNWLSSSKQRTIAKQAARLDAVNADSESESDCVSRATAVSPESERHPRYNACKCGQRKLFRAEQCRECNKNKKRAIATQVAKALKALPNAKASKKSFAECLCEECGVACYSSTGRCKECNRKEYNRRYYASVNLIAKTIDSDALQNAAMDEIVMRGIEALLKPDDTSEREQFEEDLSFTDDLLEDKKIGDPWRCKTCGALIEHHHRWCVRCKVAGVVCQAKVETLLSEMEV